MLTLKQRKTLVFIAECLETRGYFPTLAEIGDEVGINFVSSVHRIIGCLVSYGYLKRITHPKLSFKLLKKPPDGDTVVMSIRVSDTGDVKIWVSDAIENPARMRWLKSKLNENAELKEFLEPIQRPV